MTSYRFRPHRARSRGFTLIELMVAVAIIAIVAAVAYPSYLSSVRKGKRTDAMAAVAALQHAQERWRANHPTYSTSLTELNLVEPTLYTLTISEPPTPATLSTGYVVVAEGRSSQAEDSECKRMSVRLIDGNLGYGSCSSCSSFSYAPTDKCWKR